MKKKDFSGQENIDQLIEAINQVQFHALGEGAAMCQVCGCELGEGDELTAYALRAAGDPVFEVGFVMCGADEHEHPSVFTRGVHELVVTGRLGLCTDVATQSSWLVLIEPMPVVVSVASSSAARAVGDASRDADTESDNGSGIGMARLHCWRLSANKRGLTGVVSDAAGVRRRPPRTRIHTPGRSRKTHSPGCVCVSVNPTAPTKRWNRHRQTPCVS